MSIASSVSSVPELATLTDLFHLLSDKTRLTILMLLSQGERNVSSLCEELALPQPTVSHHLGLLRTQRLIANRRAGKQVYYGLDGRMYAGSPDSLVIKAEGYTVRVGREEGIQAVSGLAT